VNFNIEFGREDDGRWIAEIAELPGVLAYGVTRDEAETAVEAVALRVIADQIEEPEGDRLGTTPKSGLPVQPAPEAGTFSDTCLRHKA
jgi:predicted RNase H-like HicB family nuclease